MHRFAALAFALIAAAQSGAQTCEQWLPGDGVPGTDGEANALMAWDPDGLGPMSVRFVAAGGFRVAGNLHTQNIAAYDPATHEWSPFGAGLTGAVGAIAPLPNGEIIAAGSFTGSGSTVLNRVARWDGTDWLPLGPGVGNGHVRAVLVLPDGDIAVGGEFTQAGGTSVQNVARWNGTTWSPLGVGLSGNGTWYGGVHALAAHPSGDVYAGGGFTNSGGVPVRNLARWNGSSWTGVSDHPDGAVLALAVTPDGSVVAGGEFYNIGGMAIRGIARWDGAVWCPLSNGIPVSLRFGVRSIAVAPDGGLVVGGAFAQIDDLAVGGVARWDGTSWSAFDGGTDRSVVYAVAALPDGGALVSGFIMSAGDTPLLNIAHWDGGVWRPLGAGFNNVVNACKALPGGGVVAGGYFSSAGQGRANQIAVWDGQSWTGLGSGVDGEVGCVTLLPDGQVIAGGRFFNAGGTPVSCIARWDGELWHDLDSGVSSSNYGPLVAALAVTPAGDLLVGGQFRYAGGVPANRVARWDGEVWSPLGAGITGDWGAVYAITLAPGGEVFVGGEFQTAGAVNARNIARWDGTEWSALASGTTGTNTTGEVGALALLPDGGLVAGGSFTSAGSVAASRIARWDGSAWHALGSGVAPAPFGQVFVSALQVRTDGSLIVAGTFAFAGGIPARNIARWSSGTWSALEEGVSGSVHDLALLSDGSLAVVGRFSRVNNDVPAGFFARRGCRAACDSIDFNGDGLFPDNQDLVDYLSVFGGGNCAGQAPSDPPCNADTDFNNDGLFPDNLDIEAMFRVFGGGACSP